MLLALLLASAAIPDNVQLTSYTVGGRTAQEIRAELDHLRPSGFEEGRFDASTSWQLIWHFQVRINAQKQCYVSEVTASALIQTTLPVWSSPAQIDPSLELAWRKYRDALVSHELGHIAIANEAAESIRQLDKTVGTSADCEDVRQRFRRGAAAALEAGKRRNKEYDAETDHGILQGAKFP